MATNRKAAEALLLQYLKDIEPTGYNVDLYKNEILKDMSNADFDNWMKMIRAEEAQIVVFRPMYKAKGITIENCIKIAPKYKVELFEYLNISNDPDVPDHKTPIKYLVIDVPYKRQSQTLFKKISVPPDNKSIDELTYQPTGASKGAKVSFPELQVLLGMGLDNTIEELAQFRGGDKGGFNAYNAMMRKYGTANLTTLRQFSTGVESTKALKIYLMSAHIKPTKTA